MAYITLLLAIVFAFLIALFAVQNSMLVSVNMFKWNIEASLVLVILGAAALGFCMALFLLLYAQFRLRFQLYKSQSRIRQLEQEVGRLQPPEGSEAGDSGGSASEAQPGSIKEQDSQQQK